MSRRISANTVGLLAAAIIVALCVAVLLLTVAQLPIPPLWVPDIPPVPARSG